MVQGGGRERISKSARTSRMSAVLETLTTKSSQKEISEVEQGMNLM